MDLIPDALWNVPVVGANLMPGTLGDQVGDGPTLLVFLRHFGCIFCRETLAELRAASEGGAVFPPVLFFTMSSPTESRAFLRRYWPGVRAVSDPECVVYQGFGVERGNLRQMFGPGVWAADRRAKRSGHASGERDGDIWRMPGAFLVRGRDVLWSHEYRHAGDHPDFVGAMADQLVG